MNFLKKPRHREVKFPLLEHAMGIWVENVIARGVTLTNLLIKEKAKIFTQAFNIQESDLVFSNGWLDKFKKRNNIQRYRAHREAGSAPLESLPEERMKLRRLLTNLLLIRFITLMKQDFFTECLQVKHFQQNLFLVKRKIKLELQFFLALM